MDNISYIVLNDETLEVEDTKARTEIGDVTTLRTNAKDNLVKAVNECFQSASDGKALIASAITGKGVNTDSDATYAAMAENISSIQVGIDTSDATATAGQMLSGSTAYARGSKITGTLTDYRGKHLGNLQTGETYLDDGTTVRRLFLSGYLGIKRTSSSLTLIRIKLSLPGVVDPNTYVDVPLSNLSEGNVRAGVLIGNADGNMGITGTFTSDGTATDTQILAGEIAYVKGSKLTGTMPNRKSAKYGWCGYETVTVQPNPSASDQGQVTVPNTYNILGYYDRTSSVTANIANLNADNIKAGVLVGRYGGDSTNCITGTFTSDATATAAQILAGAIAYVRGSKVTGSMANQGAVTSALNAGGEYIIPAGYHNGSGKVTANSLASQTAGTATAAQILSGQVAYVNGVKLTGTMANRVGESYATSSTYTDKLSVLPQAGYYNGTDAYSLVATDHLARLLGITANKILAGNTICGVAGNATPRQFASGTVTAAPTSNTKDFLVFTSGYYHSQMNRPYCTVNVGFVPAVVFYLTTSTGGVAIDETWGFVSNHAIFNYSGYSYNGHCSGTRSMVYQYQTTIGTSVDLMLSTYNGVPATCDVAWFAFG